MKQFLLAALLVFVFQAEGKKSNFKNNKERIDALEKIYVVTDTFLMEHYVKHDVGINQPFNNDFALHVFKYTQSLLSRHIKAEFIHAGSVVGLHPEGNIYTIDAVDPSKNIYLPAVDESIGLENKTEMLETIEPLFERIHRMPKTRKESKSYVPDMLEKNYERVSWLGLEPNEAVLMVISSGLRKRPKGSTGKTVASAILTLGMGLYIELAPKYFNAALVAADGTLLWVGHSDTTQGMDEAQIEDSMYQTYKTMPYKMKRPKKTRARKHYSNF